MDKNNLLEHFIVFCKENFGSENKIKYEEWLNIYANAFVNDLLICKDVICNILKIRSDHINETAHNNDIEIQYYNYNKLPTNAIIHNKSNIMQSKKKTWFINIDNFIKLLLIYRTQNKINIIKTSVIYLYEIYIKFLKETNDKQNNLIILQNKNEINKNKINKNEVNNIQKIFNFGDLNIDVIYIDNDNIYFKGKDVCKILEYKDTKQSINKIVDEKNKQTLENIINITSISKSVFKTHLKGNQKNTIYINESGLYQLIMRSKKLEAKKFHK